MILEQFHSIKNFFKLLHNSLSIGIKIIDGPFVDIYKNGKYILVDDINLGSNFVLEYIENAIKNDFLSIEITGQPLAKISKHKNFGLIVSQNTNKGLYIRKRKDLGKNFYQDFKLSFIQNLHIKNY